MKFALKMLSGTEALIGFDWLPKGSAANNILYGIYRVIGNKVTLDETRRVLSIRLTEPMKPEKVQQTVSDIVLQVMHERPVAIPFSELAVGSPSPAMAA